MRLQKPIRLSPHDKRCITKALEYIATHYRNRLSADLLALEVGLSKQKLQAGMQECTGHTLHIYLLKVRIEKAKQLLEDTNDPVKSIAAAMGFKRPSHFIFTFKEFTSLTPVEYRYKNAV
jgi:transcriptional regulator GlxA family with amidase domain